MDPQVTTGGEQAADEMPTLPWRTPRKATPVRQPLSQGAIVATAMAILDAEGLDAVTMRRVAQALTTGSSSLYAHVASRDELLDLMVDRVAGEIQVPAPDPGRWQEQLKVYARDAQAVWTSHADIAKVSLANIPTGPNMLRLYEGVLALLRAGGLSAQMSAWALDRLHLYIGADVFEGALWGAKLKDESDIAGYLHALRTYFRSLPPDRFPLITSLVDSLTAGEGNQRFEFGIDILVRGLASYGDR